MVVVGKAAAAARGELNPQFFLYPSFFFYLLAAVDLLAGPLLWELRGVSPLSAAAFIVDPGPFYLIGRLVSLAFGLLSVVAVYRIGVLAYGRAAGVIAALLLAVLPLHVEYSQMAVTDVTATGLSLVALWLYTAAVVERPPAAGEGDDATARGGRLLVIAAVFAGLATSTKYNLGMLVLPAAVALVFVSRDEAQRLIAAGASRLRVWLRLVLTRLILPMLAAFILASPFVVLDASHFISDFIKQNAIQKRGWLGYENVHGGLRYNLETNLAGTLGWALLALVALGIVVALWRRRRVDWLLVPYAVIYFAYISTWNAFAARYLIPVLPVFMVLAARLIVEVVRGPRRLPIRVGASRRTTLVAGVALAVVLTAIGVYLPLQRSLAHGRSLAGVDTRLVAKEWVEGHLAAGAVIASENYGPPLVTVADGRAYAELGRTSPPAYRVFELKLPSPGVAEPTHSLRFLREHNVGYVILSSAVGDRVLAARERHRETAAFYDDVKRLGTVVQMVAPQSGQRGPTITIYQIRPGA